MRCRRNAVGPRIKFLREQKMLSQEQMAAKLGVRGWDATRFMVAKIETGLRCVTDKELMVIAKVLKVPIQEIFADVM